MFAGFAVSKRSFFSGFVHPKNVTIVTSPNYLKMEGQSAIETGEMTATLVTVKA